MKILLALVLIIIPALLINYFKGVVNKLMFRFKIAKMVFKILPLIELLFWVILIFWITKFLFAEFRFYNFLVASLIVVAILLISWYYFRNFIAGIFFRLKHKFTVGTIIEYADTTGEIKSLTSSFLVIEEKDDRLIRIPYSKLSDAVLAEHSDINTFNESKFTLSTGINLGADQTQKAIESSIGLSPWQKLNRKPQVSFLGEEEGTYRFEVNVSTRNEKHLSHLISALKKEFAKGSSS